MQKTYTAQEVRALLQGFDKRLHAMCKAHKERWAEKRNDDNATHKETEIEMVQYRAVSDVLYAWTLYCFDNGIGEKDLWGKNGEKLKKGEY